MIIKQSKEFEKHFKKRILPSKSLVKKFEERVLLFLKDPVHPLLKNHKLTGKKIGYWSFSITGNIRAIYKISEDGNIVHFFDIGTHNQVY